MCDERLSVAPMMEWTDVHWRAMMRGITRHSVLYTEMVVDSTILHNPEPDTLHSFLGKDIYESPSVIQLGGNDPETLGKASELASLHGEYSELNLNCGCPSQKVKKFQFGASLMLQPELVREITHSMQRHSTKPVTVKCRIGVDDKESYEELCHFLHTVSQSGVKKFIIHARKCLLKGLTCKQNRDIPPLHYEVVHKLVEDFPDLKFVINGGILDFEAAESHLNTGQYDWRGTIKSLPPVIGCMLGRAVYHNPLLFATADSSFYNTPDPCLTRRDIIERYCSYCDWIQDEQNGPKTIVKGRRKMPATAFLFKPLFNIFNGCSKSAAWRKYMSDYLIELRAKGGEPSLREVIELCVDNMSEGDLDARIGRDRSDMSSDKNTKLSTGLYSGNGNSVEIANSVFRRDNMEVDLDLNGVADDHSSLEYMRSLMRKEYKDRIKAL